MDRDNRWERIKLAYDLLVKGVGTSSKDILASVEKSYEAGVTDEFLKPIVATDANDEALAKIEEEDVVLFFNFRTDRPRELTAVLSQKDMPEFDMKKLKLHYLTMTRYDETFENIEVLFSKDNIVSPMGEVLANAGLTQTRIAETEKYPHVTFFFSGGNEQTLTGEKRIVVPSPSVATYDQKPEMSAYEITTAIVDDIQNNQPDFICLNYANTDMVGHTGVFSAGIKAAEVVDECLKNLIAKCLEYDYEALIIADHGNSDYMINEDGSPHTAHTLNPVPCILVSKDINGRSLKDGRLADVAPTLLEMMKVEKPALMTGVSIIENKTTN